MTASPNISYQIMAPFTNGELKKLSDGYADFQSKLHKIFLDSNLDSNTGIQVIWVDLAVLMSDDNFEKLLNIVEIKEDENEKKNQKIIPKIFIGSQPIERLQKGKLLHHKKINQLDNNIYTFYIDVFGKDKSVKQLNKEDFFNYRLQQIVKRIKANYKKGLYELEVTHEYFDFFKRVCCNNYLQGGHSSQVLPVVFTSETLMQSKAESNIKKLSDYKIWKKNNPLQVKVLLVDDFAYKKLKVKNEKAEESLDKKNSNFSKKQLLKRVWEEFNASLGEINLKIELDITVKENPEIEGLKGEYYDVILLDYNFNKEKNGVDFLRDIIYNEGTNNTTKKVNGPFGVPWIIPISSFTNAFIDEMRNKGISFIDEHFELSRGADFINTPYLFLYYFTEVIKRQLSFLPQIGALKQNINDLVNELERKSWSEIEHGNILNESFQELFQNHIKNKKDIDYFLNNSEEGLLKSVYKSFNNKDERRKKLGKQLNFYEQLLYNLAYRNFEGNEEVIIFHDLLKNLK